MRELPAGHVLRGKVVSILERGAEQDLISVQGCRCVTGKRLTIHLYHTVVQISVLCHQDLWVPGCGHEQRVNSRVDWDDETAGDLESNEEAVCHDDGSERAALVVGRVGDVEVDVCDQGTSDSNEHTTERQYWADEAF